MPLGKLPEALRLGESLPLNVLFEANMTGVCTDRLLRCRMMCCGPRVPYDPRATNFRHGANSMKLSALLAAFIIAPVLTGAAFARDFQLGSLVIDQPWSRATPKGATTGAGYLTIKNTGSTPDRLVSATLSSATTTQIHQMTMDNGVMKMREVSGGLEIKPGETVTLKPQGYHIMFMGLKEPLVKGQTAKGSLTFEHAGTIDVEFDVAAAGSSGPQAGQMQHMQMDHMH
jgi:periplasmic copper chaperone A